MQAVTLAVSDVQGVARLVVPGDHVNLMLTTDKQGAPGAAGAGEKETAFVLQNVEVLAVGSSTASSRGRRPSRRRTSRPARPRPSTRGS